MQNLINELLMPGSDSSGNVLPVTTVKRRAAEALQSLQVQHQSDLQARLSLQAENAELLSELVREQGPALEFCVDEYRIIKNVEHKYDFC